MLSNVALHCPYCEKRFFESVAYVQGQIKAMKQHKFQEVVRQMQEKRGPFYDKWKAAMEKRGEVIRCRDCVGFLYHDPKPGANLCEFKGVKVNPGQFACSLVATYSRG